ncbi:hypothetical protein PNP85_05055, partial [Halobacterium salinarum]|uniref:hypothetical protein n=1 Tax=Halobacterium salinarum TaxID=2242 RepID=UPI002557922D
VGYFALGIAQAASLIVVYLLVRHILNETRSALYGTLFVAVAGYHINSGGEPFAQALLTALMPVIFYLLFHKQNQLQRWKTAILFGLVGIGTITQNIAPVILVGVCGVLWVSRIIIDVLGRYLNIRPVYSGRILYGLIFLQIGFTWYYVVDYLEFQVWRIVEIVFFLGGSGQQQIENTGVAGVPTVAIFGTELPGVLMWAAPILSAALLVGLADYFSLREIVSDNVEDIPVHYTVIATTVFAGFTGVFAAGSGDAFRALPAVIVIIAPLAGFVLNEMRVSRGQVGALIVCGLVISVAFSGVLSPGVAKPELTDHNYQKSLEADQVAGAEFIIRYSNAAISGPYVYQYDYYSQVASGHNPDIVIREGFGVEDRESIIQFQNRIESGETTVYLDYYHTAFGIYRPATNRVYSSGNATVYIGH